MTKNFKSSFLTIIAILVIAYGVNFGVSGGCWVPPLFEIHDEAFMKQKALERVFRKWNLEGEAIGEFKERAVLEIKMISEPLAPVNGSFFVRVGVRVELDKPTFTQDKKRTHRSYTHWYGFNRCGEIIDQSGLG